MRKLIRANLEALGLQVREAVSEEHGLQQLLEGRPDLILLDLDLPDGAAWNLLDAFELQFASQPVPVVLLSAEPPSRETMQKGPVAGHLLKPFGVLSLLEQVRRLLGTPRTPS
ncbi:MAG: response regulator [Anaerolineae bacterium]|nr:response regulator [Anaerolineae bacterium]